jgi:hypothetical protein
MIKSEYVLKTSLCSSIYNSLDILASRCKVKDIARSRVIRPKEVQADGIETIRPELLEDVGPHFRHGHTFVSKLAGEQEQPLSIHQETVRVPGNSSGQAIVRSKDKDSKEEGIDQEMQAESHLGMIEQKEETIGWRARNTHLQPIHLIHSMLFRKVRNIQSCVSRRYLA